MISVLRKSAKLILVLLPLSLAGITITGCDLAGNSLKTDRAADMSVQDFRDGLAPRPLPEETAGARGDDDSIPSLQSYVVEDTEGLDPMPLVSVSVNQTVPLRDILFELAKQADYDIELDPNIGGSIIYTARNKPFDVVIERISEIAGLRYTIKDGTLSIQEDTPYIKSYKMDYVNYTREGSSDISTDISVISSEGADLGSGFEISSSTSSDFWADLEANIEQILGVEAGTGGMRSSDTPQISAAQRNQPAPVQAVSAPGGQGVTVEPPEAVLQVDSLPPATGGEGGEQAASGFTINRQAGLISVYAPGRKHKEVAEFLREVKRSSMAQVLIEAKVLEVSLDDEFSVGINWDEINPSERFSAEFNADAPALFSGADLGGQGIDMTIAVGEVEPVINALSRFGTVRALASPRVTVLNNQSAVLNVAQNRVFFELEIDITQNDNTTETSVESEIRNVPEGVLINVQPSINLDENKVSMAVRPTITSVADTVEDPAIPIALADFTANAAQDLPDEILDTASLVPILDIQEIDSVIDLNSGEVAVMGGLMQDRVDSETTAVPVLGEIPVMGNLFKGKSDRVIKTELVIFLKATIVEPHETIHDVDRQIYKRFSGDRRPYDL